MHFMSLFYSVIISLNTFEKNKIIENIGRHKRVDQTWVVNDNEASFLNRRYPLIIHDYVLQKLNEKSNVSSSHVKRSVRRGLIYINGRKATNEWNVQIGDTVQLVSQYSVAPFSGHNSSTGYLSTDTSNERVKSVGVLFEDAHCAVVNKPQGMTIFPTPGSASQSADWSLQSALLFSLRPFNYSMMHMPVLEGEPDENILGSISPLRRPQCVHRLDKGTGGLVLVAKTRLALTTLTGFFMDRKVSKKYLSLLRGKMVLQDTIGLNVESRGSGNELVGVASFDVDGKQAVSEVRVLAHSPCPRLGWVTLVEVSPLTGRTHQIRKHMQMLGHSIVGDKRYGGCLQQPSSGREEFNTDGSDNLYDNIMYLWAVSLSFPHPIHGHIVDISLPEPFEIGKRLAQCN